MNVVRNRLESLPPARRSVCLLCASNTGKIPRPYTKVRGESLASKIYPDAPRVAVGAVVFHQDRVLLVLRKQPPAAGVWAIPGGSVELGESLQAAAEREVLEETGLRIKAGDVIYTFDVVERDEAGRVRFHYVIVDLKGELLDPTQPPVPADDVTDAGWFTLDEVKRVEWPVSEATRALLWQVMMRKND